METKEKRNTLSENGQPGAAPDQNSLPLLGKLARGEFFRTNQILIRIMERKNLERKVTRLYKLMTREDLAYQALTKLRPNKGIGTLGVDRKALDGFGKGDIKTIVKELREGNYKFSPVRRVYIPKPGKKGKRPLGIPTLKDKIVQEMIRLILEAIYEPIFEQVHANANYGFRPKKSVADALQKLHYHSPSNPWCVEGDIKGAYDNVNRETLIKILEKRIKDKKFLELIQNGLYGGIMEGRPGRTSDPLTGVPQGGIASPILFNIYMAEFDEYIINSLLPSLEKINVEEKRIKTAKPKRFNRLTWKLHTLRRKLNEIKKSSSLTQKEKAELKSIHAEIKATGKLQRSTPSVNVKRSRIRGFYIRYADDWVFLTNGGRLRAEQIKDHIGRWLKDNLDLDLSPEKTIITNLEVSHALFLGHRMGYYGPRRTATRKRPHLIWRRSVNPRLYFDVDRKRLEKRLIDKQFLCKRKTQGRRKPAWSVLEDAQIVYLYNSVIRGLINFYRTNLKRYSLIWKYVYILRYSCMHTLANKHRLTLKKVIKKYGKHITVKTPTRSEPDKVTSLIGYRTGKTLFEEKKQEPTNEIFSPRVNWRTTYKLNKCCVICGNEFNVQMHHIKHIRKMGLKLVGFDKVMASLNRKQIMVCVPCHGKIHRGEYHGMALKDLYDLSLAQI